MNLHKMEEEKNGIILYKRFFTKIFMEYEERSIDERM